MANPSPNTEGLQPFQKGQSGNPGGKTAEQRRAEVEAAEIAATLRLAALRKMAERIADGTLDAVDIVTGDNLRLFKDSEDRAHGTPKAAVDHTSSDGTMTPGPTRIIIEAASDDSEDQASD